MVAEKNPRARLRCGTTAERDVYAYDYGAERWKWVTKSKITVRNEVAMGSGCKTRMRLIRRGHATILTEDSYHTYGGLLPHLRRTLTTLTEDILPHLRVKWYTIGP